MNNKHIYQIVSKEGKPVAPATSAPGCFIHDGVPVSDFPDRTWGEPFAEPCSGNKVEFYISGQEYFSAVAAAIAGAKKSIYIAGWQVNFDVELVSGKTLLQYLQDALKSQPALQVFVMPWLSPKVGVDTGDFETMLAVFQLNAGSEGTARAHAMPALAQSDMSGPLGTGFAHHQKLVVIDNERAFVGGIDLAYGRRDDCAFSLTANGRIGNELYNSCIPAVHTLSRVEQSAFLTRAELLCACFDGVAGRTGAFATSATWKPLAATLDAADAANEFYLDTKKTVSDWWEATDLIPEMLHHLRDVPMDTTQSVARWAYGKFDAGFHGKLDGLRETGGANVTSAVIALVAWLNNGCLDQLPAEVRQDSVKLIEAFLIATLMQLSSAAQARTEMYPNLQKLKKIVPASGKTLSKEQPRMPWHDVHSSITGPAVSDLSRNFVRRWNGIAQRYEQSFAGFAGRQEIGQILGALGAKPLVRIKITRLPAPPPPASQPKAGKSWVQVLRSAPVLLQKDEMRADASAPTAKAVQRPQDNCLKATLKVIQGAQKFIYIEGQFFQSAYGNSAFDSGPPSGPLSALTDITSSSGYKRYAAQLGIAGKATTDIPGAIRWSQINRVRSDIKGKGYEFWNDLKVVLKNIATIEASRLIGKQQEAVLNPIAEAIARQIETHIYAGHDFHVYMVIPVHPEGTLNTLNIMSQVHLTMQSLVFGSHSLVNRIRRAILTVALQKEKKITKQEAQATIAQYTRFQLLNSDPNNSWKSFLTLLNLRTWNMIENRPVTEQIYIHSKLIIVDDRVAIIGSANINDRSQMGDRDSELAVVIRDDEAVKVKLDSIKEDVVSKNVNDLRKNLWRKIFGLEGGVVPARDLESMISTPGAKKTWRAIQKIAQENLTAYEKSFKFLPTSDASNSSIWSCWDNKQNKLKYHMPFNERFWRGDEVRDELTSRDATSRAPELKPVGVQGFIVALPTGWTDGENNRSAMNLTLIAENNLDATGPEAA